MLPGRSVSEAFAWQPNPDFVQPLPVLRSTPLPPCHTCREFCTGIPCWSEILRGKTDPNPSARGLLERIVRTFVLRRHIDPESSKSGPRSLVPEPSGLGEHVATRLHLGRCESIGLLMHTGRD